MNANITQDKIIKMKKAYSEFLATMQELELQGNGLIKKSLARLDKDKINSLLEDINKI